ncbi:MAG: 4-(cytidine 5'-diphospho)-2-C-methyl-D-erythritol kinase [Ruminococcus sp.]|nr:4-(cytidine 5'-diphospho)-2-C-methyl-D-erythritol kinase [Ruminococcus sp.]
MKVKAAAKINLALDVYDYKRPDGYHEIESIFQTVSIYDEVTVELIENRIELTCEVPEKFASSDPIPCDERNIAYKAAKRFIDENNLETGCRIHIKKGIPSQAGMGGGSTDAAAVLFCLNKLTGKTFSAPEKLGADVPFFLTGGTAYVSGIGEKIYKINDYSGKIIVIAKGKECVSTAKAYRLLDELREKYRRLYGDSAHIYYDKKYAPVCVKLMSDAIHNGKSASEYVRNSFEDAIHLDEVDDIKTKMMKCGAEASCMTGSGSAVFGIFADAEKAQSCAELLENDGYFSQVCEPVSESFIIIE